MWDQNVILPRTWHSDNVTLFSCDEMCLNKEKEQDAHMQEFPLTTFMMQLLELIVL